jgi:putative transposase
MDDAYLWAAVRYVERNPMSAGMVARAQDYRWSSAAAHCGLRKDPLLDPAFPPPGLVEHWADWLSTPENEEKTRQIRQATNTGRPCGEKEYVQRIEHCLGRNLTPAPRGRKPRSIHPKQDDLFND